jgi:glucan biosynthesis protein C
MSCASDHRIAPPQAQDETLILPLLRGKPVSKPVPERLFGLDYLRAGAAIAVVLLHAAMPYMAHPLPAVKWAVTENTRSETIDFLGWGINSFIMPLFFLLSGFLTSQASKRRTTRELLIARGKRLGAAFAVGCVLILPLDLYIWVLGFVVQGEAPIAKLRSLKIEGELRQYLSGVAHLWYLQCLATLTLVACVAKLISPIRARQVPISWVLLLAAVFSAFALRSEPEILLGFRNHWFPSSLKLLFYFGFFAIGWRFANSEEACRRGAWPLALSAAAILLFVCLLPEIQQHVASPVSGLRLTMLAVTFVLVGGSAAIGVFARCAGGFRSPPPIAIRYVASASLWIYLLHHPSVALVQVDLVHVQISPELKTLIAFIVGLAFPLLTYRVLVQKTVLGRLLEGAPRKQETKHSECVSLRNAA